MTNAFFSMHRQGFVRVAACTPRIAVGDPQRNARGDARAHARRRGAQRRPHAVPGARAFSAYAIDDLLLQDALLDGVEAAIARARRGLARRCSRVVHRRRAGAAQRPPVQLRRRRSRAARILGVMPKSFLPNYREYYENRWFAPGVGLVGPRGDARRPDRAVRHRPPLRGEPTCRTSSSTSRSARTSGRRPAVDAGRARRRADPLQPVGVEHRRRQGGRPRDAVRVAVDALPGRLRLFRGGPGREHDRPRVGRPGDDPRARRAARADASAFRVEEPDGGRRRRRRAPAARAHAHADVQQRPPWRRAIRRRRSGASRSSTSRTFDDVGLERAIDRFPFVPDDPDAARPRLLRGVQHPGAGPAASACR